MTTANSPQSRPHAREQIADAVVHVVGVALVMLAVPVLLTLTAVWREEAAVVAAMSVYGASLLAMILMSASYNLAAIRFPGRRILKVLRRLDHGTIYLKIAGTYTPFAVIAGGPLGRWLLIGIWSGAAIGFLGKMFAPEHWARKWEIVSLLLYLAMGWAFVPAAGPISASVTEATLILILVGGGLYTVGVVFHLWERLPYQNAIWHVFVLAASFVFYSAMIVEVAIGI